MNVELIHNFVVINVILGLKENMNYATIILSGISEVVYPNEKSSTIILVPLKSLFTNLTFI